MIRRGFTAPEFLMAISLIALGVAAVHHYAGVAPPQARTTACASNVRQLGLALTSYAQDYAGRLPPGPREWAPAMVYIKNEMVFICPAEKEREGSPAERSDYAFDFRLQSDDLPQSLLVGDDVPDRHRGRYWVGGRLDGAVFIWPAADWQNQIGKVVLDATPTGQQ